MSGRLRRGPLASERNTVVVAGLALALLASSCGSGDGSAVGDGDSVQEQAESTVLQSDSPTESEDDGDLGSSLDESPSEAETTTTTETTTTLEATTTSTTEATTTTLTESAEAIAGTGSALTPNIGLSDLQAVVTDVMGPTVDVSAEASRLGLFPASVPTLADASINSTQMEMYRVGEENLQHSNRIGYWTSVPIAEAMATYEAELIAQGYEIRDTTNQTNSDGSEAGTIRTNLENEGDYTTRSLQVTFRTGDFEGTTIDLWYQSGDVFLDQLSLYSGWTSNGPIPADGELRGAKVVVTPFGDPQNPDRLAAWNSAHWYHYDTDEEAVRAEIGELLNGGGEYVLDGDLESSSFNLTSSQYEKGGSMVISESGERIIVELKGSWNLS